MSNLQVKVPDIPLNKLNGFIVDENNCWNWPRVNKILGYGYISVGHSTRFYAHRVFYYFFNGDLIDGMTIDHLCRNRACVNPEHLEQVSPRINKERGYSPAMINRRKTKCPKCNCAYTLKKNGKRYCKPCFNRLQLALYHQRKLYV